MTGHVARRTALLPVLALIAAALWPAIALANEGDHGAAAHDAHGHPDAVKSIELGRGALSGYRTRAKKKTDARLPVFLVPGQSHEFLVIDNDAAWAEFWKAHHEGAKPHVSGAAEEGHEPSGERPKVNFEKHMVLALFAGRKVLAADTVEAIQHGERGMTITAILPEREDGLVVHYEDTSGEPADGPPMLVANPFVIVKVARVNGVVSFTDAHVHHVDPSLTAFFGVILALMILCLALEEKIHAKKSIIVGVFAVVSLFLGDALGVLPIGPLTNIGDEQLWIPVYIAAIDWEVIAIILGASVFVDVTSRSGIFTWIAIRLTKLSGGDPLKLLVYYGAMTVLFSAVLNNVTAMIIVGSLTGVSLGKLKRANLMLGFLLVEGLLTNVGGLLTLISSVPNIIVGNEAGISFVQFFIYAAPYVFFATILTLVLGARLYRIKSFDSAEERAEGAKEVAGFDENDGVESQAFFNFSAAIFVLFIMILATTSNLPILRDLKMGYVAIMFATIMLVAYKSEVDKFYAKVDWDLIGFFGALFVVINVMEHAGVLKAIGGVISKLLGLGDTAGPASLLWGAAVASSVTDNIPLAAVLAKILGGAEQVSGADSPFWWAVIFGANLGGNLTPIGSASTVVAVTVMHKNGVEMGFAGFVKAAVPFAIAQLILATAYVLTLGLLAVWWVLLIIGLIVLVVRARGGNPDDGDDGDESESGGVAG